MASTINYSMYNDTNAKVIGMVAAGTIRKGCAVKLHTTAGQVVAAAAITDVVFGVAQIAAASGESVPVQLDGVALMEVAAAITLGALVMVQASAADGSIDVAGGATAFSIGQAMAAADNADEFVPVRLFIAGKTPANT